MCIPMVTCSICGSISALDHTAWDCSVLDEEDDFESLAIRYPKQLRNLILVAVNRALLTK